MHNTGDARHCPVGLVWEIQANSQAATPTMDTLGLRLALRTVTTALSSLVLCPHNLQSGHPWPCFLVAKEAARCQGLTGLLRAVQSQLWSCGRLSR